MYIHVQSINHIGIVHVGVVRGDWNTCDCITISKQIIRSDIGATKVEDITGDVQAIRNRVQNITDPNDCCSYEYQLLDKFCASRNPVHMYMYIHIQKCIYYTIQ